MAYQALYRKWRPNTFDDLIGQEAIVTTLRNQIASGRIAHAYLFCGSRGTGKTSTAKVMARAVNCANSVEGEPCGECAACAAMYDENNMDIIEMDAASNNGVDEIRDLREKVKYPPSVGKYRVYIIDEVHMLSTGAFNALLKTLEEPPPYIVFILATTEVQKLPATILSRCQRFDFKRIQAKTIAGRLSEVAKEAGGVADERALMAIARQAQGGMRDAISLLDLCLSYGDGQVTLDLVRDVLGASSYEFLSGFVSALIENDMRKSLLDVDTLMRDGREASVFLQDLTEHIRALILAKACDNLPDLLEVSSEDAAAYKEQSANVELPSLARYLDIFLRAENEIKWTNSPRIVLEMAVVRACYPQAEHTIEALEDRVSQLEKKLLRLETSGVSASAPKPERDTQKSEPKTPLNEEPKAEKPNSPVSDKGIWEAGISAAKALNGKFVTFLQGATFGGIEDDMLTVCIDKSQDVYIRILETPTYLTKLEDSFSNAAGKPLKVRLISGEAPKPPLKDAENPNISMVIDFFGRENVDVRDDD